FGGFNNDGEPAELVRVALLDQTGECGWCRLFQTAQFKSAGSVTEVHLGIQIQRRRIILQELTHAISISTIERVQPGSELTERCAGSGSCGLAVGHLRRSEFRRWLSRLECNSTDLVGLRCLHT